MPGIMYVMSITLDMVDEPRQRSRARAYAPAAAPNTPIAVATTETRTVFLYQTPNWVSSNNLPNCCSDRFASVEQEREEHFEWPSNQPSQSGLHRLPIAGFSPCTSLHIGRQEPDRNGEGRQHDDGDGGAGAPVACAEPPFEGQ